MRRPSTFSTAPRMPLGLDRPPFGFSAAGALTSVPCPSTAATSAPSAWSSGGSVGPRMLAGTLRPVLRGLLLLAIEDLLDERRVGDRPGAPGCVSDDRLVAAVRFLDPDVLRDAGLEHQRAEQFAELGLDIPGDVVRL